MRLSLLSFVTTLLTKITPRRQINFLIEEANFPAWEAYRESLIRRWANLNVVVRKYFLTISRFIS